MRRPLLPTPWFITALVLLSVLRLPHLTGPLDDPHSWRQCDTAEMSRVFAREGIDLLRPSVAWLGAHRTLIFEFPLPEALAALPAAAWGWDPLWDRLVALAATAVAALYLFRIARELAGSEVARLATVLFVAAPLVQFYSRAAHVDPFATAAAHAFLHHALRAVRGGGVGHGLAAALAGALAAMVKVPYLVPVLAPLAWAMVRAPRRGRVAGLLLGAVVAAAFVAWRAHVRAVNGAAPDWDWLPGYYKEVDPWWWYVGQWRQRLEPGAWATLAQRLAWEVATPLGAALALAGLARRGHGQAHDARVPVALWLAAALLYLLVFFPLNVIHNYYQFPFAAPLAGAAALGLVALAGEHGGPRRAAAWAALAAVLALAVVLPVRRGWYRVDAVRVAAGAAIAAHTPPGELVVVVDRGSEYTDPRLLHRADRHGWAVRAEDVSPGLLARLVDEGAAHLAWVEEAGESRLIPPLFLDSLRRARVVLTAPGAEAATVHLYTLHGVRR
jgi:4-amino-4-deoxy-L-arabinose transferase-like glycosyltransferase